MAIVNGTFDTNLSGWNIWTIYPPSASVTWDNGKAKLYTWDCVDSGRDLVILSQEFLIDNTMLKFDLSSNGYYYARPYYRLSVFINNTWTQIAHRRYGDFVGDPTSENVSIDVSQYIGKNARIVFGLIATGVCLIYRDKIMWVDNVMLYSLACPSTPKCSGDPITLQATPKDGIGPYIVTFKKDDNTIDPSRFEDQSNPINNTSENETITRVYTLNDVDIANATGGTITFSVLISDSCPTGAQTCEEFCIINVGCRTPICNFIIS